MIDRRSFVRSAAGTLAGFSLAGPMPSVLARIAAGRPSSDGRILVVVQLTGGNDGINTLVPHGDDAYAANRYALRIPEAELVRVSDHVGMHPALRSLDKTLESGRLAWVQGVGYPQPNRSHFESMDLWHTAHRMEDARRLGWLGRLADSLDGSGRLPPVHLGREAQPLALASDHVPATSIRSADSLMAGEAWSEDVASLMELSNRVPRDGGNSLLEFVQRQSVAASEAARQLAAASQTGGRGVAYPAAGLGGRLRQVADMIAAGLPVSVYYVTLDGFDTHANQRAAHASLLEELGGAVSALLADLDVQGNADRVLVLAFSEFGRRLRENASLGTDHGAASVALLAGPRMAGPLAGTYPSLVDLDDGDLKYQVDYRSMYATILQQWLRVEPDSILGGSFTQLPVFA